MKLEPSKKRGGFSLALQVLAACRGANVAEWRRVRVKEGKGGIGGRPTLLSLPLSCPRRIWSGCRGGLAEEGSWGTWSRLGDSGDRTGERLGGLQVPFFSPPSFAGTGAQSR